MTILLLAGQGVNQHVVHQPGGVEPCLHVITCSFKILTEMEGRQAGSAKRRLNADVLARVRRDLSTCFRCAGAGRWRGGSVAVKVIAHDRRVGSNIEAQCRESMLSSHIQHPNVVTTYKVPISLVYCIRKPCHGALCKVPMQSHPMQSSPSAWVDVRCAARTLHSCGCNSQISCMPKLCGANVWPLDKWDGD